MNEISRRALVAAALLVPTAVVSGMAASRESRTRTVVADATLPATVGPWESEEVKLTDSERSMLDSPAASQRVYRNPATGDVVQILLLQVNNTQNAHDPRLCMAGSGYRDNEDRVIPSPWTASGRGYPVSRTEFEKGDSKVTMYYWLQTPDGSVADMSSGMKWEGIRRALTGSTVKGVAVRVIALPHTGDLSTPTNPAVAEALWRTISEQVRVDGLIARM